MPGEHPIESNEIVCPSINFAMSKQWSSILVHFHPSRLTFSTSINKYEEQYVDIHLFCYFKSLFNSSFGQLWLSVELNAPSEY
jgi:hypothetical protein